MRHGTKFEPERHGPAGLRTFVNIARLWDLGVQEQMAMLGISEHSNFDDWIAHAQSHIPVTIPMEVIERIGYVLSIYGSLVTLSLEECSGDWLRAPNSSSTFNGSSALELMISGDFNDLRKVARYLLGQIYGT
ncbi:MAG TPA: DUF2384 domain-containing protein [Sphingopyxis sp.]|nr:DUF2384 domain-containing protein [Sphingopyxis sp.]